MEKRMQIVAIEIKNIFMHYRMTQKKAFLSLIPHCRISIRVSINLLGIKMTTIEDAYDTNKMKVLAFDVFGTVVDWHGSIAREMDALQLRVDGDRFALAWRAGYVPAMQKVMSGELGWTRLDDLHRIILDKLLAEFKIKHLTETQKNELNRIWHRLDAWADTVQGLQRLKSKYTICTLSNGNLGLLTNLSKHAALPWDCILSAEIFKKYKPAPETYLGVAKVFDVYPDQVMLVAAHQSDLDAAHHCGLKTAYIERPLEYGITQKKEIAATPANTYHASGRFARLLNLSFYVTVQPKAKEQKILFSSTT
jgi:2-haloacid dehalogenase